MFRQLIVFAAVLALQQQQFAAAAGSADLPTQAAKPVIICVGDGLTEGAFSHKHEGWGLLMQERYVRKVRGRSPELMHMLAGVSASRASRRWLCAQLNTSAHVGARSCQPAGGATLVAAASLLATSLMLSAGVAVAITH
jgi:hypothetical protein